VSVAESFLSAKDLTITTRADDGRPVTLVEGFNLHLQAGQRIALVGESGSGKTVSARALTRLDSNLTVTGSVRLSRAEPPVLTELTRATEREMEAIRGARVSMVFQDPLGALNPLMTIGRQVIEPLLVRGEPRRAAWQRAINMLQDLGVPDARLRVKAYPHEFSGGMRQRVVMAMALIAEPEFLIADEPTTALDVRVQAQVLRRLTEVTRERGLGVLLITHDIGIVAGFADSVAVMYAGRIIETGKVDEVLATPAHPYTRGLLGTVPRITTRPERLVTLPGSPPRPQSRPAGCGFAPRCQLATKRCRETEPPPQVFEEGREVSCFHPLLEVSRAAD
jgi:oligopeptide/dipeptide ABC transporter ATP-binding protein